MGKAYITMKIEETENLKLKNVSNIQTSTSQMNNLSNSDIELAVKLPKFISKEPKFQIKKKLI